MSEEEATTTEGEAQEEEASNATEEVDPVNDTMPGLLLGIQAIVGTVWWLLTMFLYIGSNASDKLQVASADSIPLIWMWSAIGTTATMWQALSHLATLIFYLVVSVIELVAWIVWTVAADGEFATLWIGTIGYWGSLIAYVLPPVFALLHLIMATGSGGLGGVTTADGGTHDLFLMIAGFTLWIVHGLLHILFVPAFLAHIAAQPCVCSVEAPEALAEDADEEAAAAHAEAVAEHEKTCLEECPPADECTLEKEEEESDEDWQARCDEAAKAAAEEGEAEESEGDGFE